MLQKGMEVLRQRSTQLDPLAGPGLTKAELYCMKEIPAERRHGTSSYAQLPCRAVQRVSHDGMSERGKVHANLVCAAGVQVCFNQRCVVDAQQRAPIGASFSSFGQHDAAAGGHARATFGVAPDRQVDAPVSFLQHALHERDISFLDLAPPERLAKLRVRKVILRNQDHAGSVFIQPVNDPGTQSVCSLGQLLPPPKQRVDQRPASNPRAGMNRHASGLIHCDDVFILIKQIERNRFRLSPPRWARFDVYVNPLPASDSLRRFTRPPIDEHQPRLNQFLDPRAAQLWTLHGDKSVQPRARVRRRGKKLAMSSRISQSHEMILAASSPAPEQSSRSFLSEFGVYVIRCLLLSPVAQGRSPEAFSFFLP